MPKKFNIMLIFDLNSLYKKSLGVQMKRLAIGKFCTKMLLILKLMLNNSIMLRFLIDIFKKKLTPDFYYLYDINTNKKEFEII